MAILDEIERTERGIAKVRAAAPGLAQLASPVISPRPSAATSAAPPAMVPRPFGSRIGEGARNVVNRGIGMAEDAVNQTTALPRADAGIARDFTRAVAGLPESPNAGRALGGVTLPRLAKPTVAPPPVAPTSGPSVTLLENGQRPPESALRPRANFSGVTSRVLPGASGATAGTPPTNPVAGILRATDRNGNSVYSDTASGLEDGTRLANAGFGTGTPIPGGAATPAVAGAAVNLAPTASGAPTAASGVATASTVPTPAAATPAVAARPVAGAAPSVVAPRPQADLPMRGSQGGIIRNPDNGTLADQIARAVTSSSLRGSPSARAAVANAIMAEAGYANQERQAALSAGYNADQAAAEANAAAPNQSANRNLEAQRINANLADSAADRVARQQEVQLARRPTQITAVDGTVGFANDDGRFTPVTGADGKAVRAAVPPRQTGALTQADLLKSYDERYKAINTGIGTPEQKQAQLDALQNDPMYANLRGGSSSGSGTAAPAVGTVVDGYRFKGGDPGDQRNWEAQ